MHTIKAIISPFAHLSASAVTGPSALPAGGTAAAAASFASMAEGPAQNNLYKVTKKMQANTQVECVNDGPVDILAVVWCHPVTLVWAAAPRHELSGCSLRRPAAPQELQEEEEAFGGNHQYDEQEVQQAGTPGEWEEPSGPAGMPVGVSEHAGRCSPSNCYEALINQAPGLTCTTAIHADQCPHTYDNVKVRPEQLFTLRP
jgi:hypothetical protein